MYSDKLFFEKFFNCNSFLLIMLLFVLFSKKVKWLYSNGVVVKSDGDFFLGKVRCVLILSLINFLFSGFW